MGVDDDRLVTGGFIIKQRSTDEIMFASAESIPIGGWLFMSTNFFGGRQGFDKYPIIGIFSSFMGLLFMRILCSIFCHSGNLEFPEAIPTRSVSISSSLP